MSRNLKRLGEKFALPSEYTSSTHACPVDRRGRRTKVSPSVMATGERVLAQHLATVHTYEGTVLRVGMAPDAPPVSADRVAAFAEWVARSAAAQFRRAWKPCRAKGHPKGCRTFDICQRVTDGLDAELAALTAADMPLRTRQEVSA